MPGPTRAVQRLMLRTHRTRIRLLWSIAHRIMTRAVVAYMRARNEAAAVYATGSFARGDPVYGLSDIDLVAVAPTEASAGGAAYELARERRRRLRKHLPVLRDLVTVGVYHEASLRDAVEGSCLTYGLKNDAGERACGMVGGSLRVGDNLGLRMRPKIPPSLAGWRLLAGPERRRGQASLGGDERLIAAWLEVQCWWRRAFWACCDPEGLLTPFLCLKLFTEPARAWLWATEGRTPSHREQVLDLALRSMPDEEQALRAAVALQRSLPRSPEPPLEQALGFLRRTTARLARRLADDAGRAGATEVKLLGCGARPPARVAAVEAALGPVAGERAPTWLPLVDWRARAAPAGSEEWLGLVAESAPEDPAVVALAARCEGGGLQPALRDDGLLVLPTDREQAALLRAVQCPQTDPVSFALADGRPAASFPALAGWSAHDCARRAVAEHAAWLRTQRDAGAPREASLGLLFTAARAALFLESIQAREPELALTTVAVGDALTDRASWSRGTVDAALAGYADGGAASAGTMSAFHALVAAFPAYTGGRTRCGEPRRLDTVAAARPGSGN